MQTGDLFVAKVRDLRQRVVGPSSEFDLLGGSALLRHLLLDRLAHEANREARLLLSFVTRDARWTTDHTPDSIMTVWVASADPLAPDNGCKSKTMGLDGFLAHPVAYINGVVVSVKDAIKYAAHVDGGVHSGAPRSEVEQAVQWLERSGTRLEGSTPGTGLILGIGAVTVRGLTPLARHLDPTFDLSR